MQMISVTILLIIYAAFGIACGCLYYTTPPDGPPADIRFVMGMYGSFAAGLLELFLFRIRKK